MNDLDLPRLAALAEAATPGPWEMDDQEVFAANGRCVGSTELFDDAPNADQSIADSAYIAAADPATILALIGQLEVMEQKAVGIAMRLLAAEAELAATRRATDQWRLDCGRHQADATLTEAMDRIAEGILE
jgi:hypothetical protein